MKNSKNITEGNIYKNFIFYAIPLVLSSLLSNLYTAVDTVIAGNFIGEYALGAISATSSFEILFRAFFNGFGLGFSIYVAHLFGKRDFLTLKRDTANTVALVMGISIIISAFAICFKSPIMAYLKVDPILKADADMYFCILASSYVFTFVNFTLLHVLHVLGNTSCSLYVSLGSAILNIGGNLLTVCVFDMGVVGLGLSTVASTAAATVIYSIVLRRTLGELTAEKVPFRFDFSGIGRSSRYTFIVGIQKVAFCCVGFLIAPMINGMGAEASAGYNVSTRIYELCSLTILNVTSAMECHTAQCVGMKSYHKIPRGLRVGVLINSVVLLPIVVTFVAFSNPIVSLFFRDGYDGAAFEYALRYASVYIPFLYIHMIDHIMHSYIRSLGKILVVFAVTIFGSVIRVALTAILVLRINMDGVYLAQVISWSFDALISIIVYMLFYRTAEQIKRIVHSMHFDRTDTVINKKEILKTEGSV